MFTYLGVDLDSDTQEYECANCGTRDSVAISDYERHPFTEQHPQECPVRETTKETT